MNHLNQQSYVSAIAYMDTKTAHVTAKEVNYEIYEM